MMIKTPHTSRRVGIEIASSVLFIALALCLLIPVLAPLRVPVAVVLVVCACYGLMRVLDRQDAHKKN